jgi:hypothetical protein
MWGFKTKLDFLCRRFLQRQRQGFMLARQGESRRHNCERLLLFVRWACNEIGLSELGRLLTDEPISIRTIYRLAGAILYALSASRDPGVNGRFSDGIMTACYPDLGLYPLTGDARSSYRSKEWTIRDSSIGTKESIWPSVCFQSATACPHTPAPLSAIELIDMKTSEN